MATATSKPKKLVQLSDKAKRLIEVYNDWKKVTPFPNGTPKFAEYLDVSHTHIWYMMNGDREVSQMVTDLVCKKLGYSPAWFINGDGRKKVAAGDRDSTLLKDVGSLRIEIELLRNEISARNARMAGLENEIADLQQFAKEMKARFNIK